MFGAGDSIGMLVYPILGMISSETHPQGYLRLNTTIGRFWGASLVEMPHPELDNHLQLSSQPLPAVKIWKMMWSIT